MTDPLLPPADLIVKMMERIYSYGMTTISGGNLSILDNEGNIWITPSGIDKGKLTKKDIMCVKKDGTVEGIHRPSVELPFHQGIYEVRPDIKAIVHAHPPALVSFSMARKSPNYKLLLNSYKHILGKVGVAAYAVPGSEKLKKNIAKEFAKGGDAVILENHGIVVGQSNLSEAFSLFETLEDLAHLEINARTLGDVLELSDEELCMIDSHKDIRLNEFLKPTSTEEEINARIEISTIIQRLYDRKLFISTAGSISKRLSDDSILITPYQKDRKYIDTNDLVLVKDDLQESGKVPCEMYELHKTIYEKHPDIASIIIANPRFFMAFAVTNVEYNTHIIPEAYVVLRDIHKVPFGIGKEHYNKIADIIAKDHPVLLVENGYAIVTADNLLSSFDMLEVAVYSAKALIYSKNVGKIIKISDEEIEEIINKFQLTDK